MSIQTIPIKEIKNKTFNHVFLTFIQNKKIASRKSFLSKEKIKDTGHSNLNRNLSFISYFDIWCL